MERLTIEELIEHCDRKMNRLPSGNILYQEHESVRAYLQILRHYIATGLMPESAVELAQAERDGRLVVLAEGKATWIKAILAERDHQDHKWGYPQENTYCEWSSILAEEVGELAKELNELNFGRGDVSRMEAEAIQVAAVALAILEQSGVAQRVTVQAAVALGRVTSQVDERRGEVEEALEKENQP